jgi:type VI secretion system secreted protein Hcp
VRCWYSGCRRAHRVTRPHVVWPGQPAGGEYGIERRVPGVRARSDKQAAFAQGRVHGHQGCDRGRQLRPRIENPETIGSATAGAGTVKAKFHDFTIKKPVDAASPLLFEASAMGGHYNTVSLVLRRSGMHGGGKPYLVFTFKTVSVKSVDWSGQSGGNRPEEQVVFEYGSLGIAYTKQLPDGSPVASPITTGWDRVRNISAPRRPRHFRSNAWLFRGST